jgi:hypothetical protein
MFLFYNFHHLDSSLWHGPEKYQATSRVLPLTTPIVENETNGVPGETTANRYSQRAKSYKF